MADGVGTEQLAPLARMWRSVYTKAAEVAEARTQELLKYHVYVYPHGEGGGGGGAGLVELGRAVATAGQSDLRVPASGALPTGYSGLTVVATGRNNSATVTQNTDVYLFFNDDVDYSTYNYRYLEGTATGTVVTGNSPGSAALNLGLAPALNAAEPQTVWSLSGVLPLHEGTALPKAGQFLSAGLRQAAQGPFVRTTMGVYAPSPAVPITSVHLRCLSPGWRAGAVFVVYGHGPATGGGGGAGADVVITTDASLTAAESPANTFALAARLSPDAGNALALRANGLYATDTGSGGGGTGNTTMYTQTGTPTGATNSLWFNPSESA